MCTYRIFRVCSVLHVGFTQPLSTWQVQEPPGAAPPPARGREAAAATAGLRSPDPRVTAAAAPAFEDAATAAGGLQPGPVLPQGGVGAAAKEALPDSERRRGGYWLPSKGDIIRRKEGKDECSII